MCGIAGAIGIIPSTANINKALHRLGPRGPDAHGAYVGQLHGHPICLLHTRLAIIDLDERSGQPFIDDQCVLVYNGEIYNFLELRERLKKIGYRFRTNSDTEVVIKSYQEFGEGCVDHFEGMWSFALLDQRHQRLFISRDRFGEKPFYYSIWDGVLYFASEVKALSALAGRTPKVNFDQIRRYLVNGYRSIYKRPETFFSDVHDFPSGHYVCLSGPSMPKPKRYWSLGYMPLEHMTKEDAVSGVKERLEQSMRLRMRSDVPVAFCLSGGVDSTILSAMAVKRLGYQIHTFSIIDKDARYNEKDNIEQTVKYLDCAHHAVHIGTDGFLDEMERLVGYHDSPVSTISYYVHSLLSKAISERGYKVAISGTGADELLTGYYDHYGFWLAEQSQRDDLNRLLEQWREGYGAAVRNPFLKDPLIFKRTPSERGHIYLNREVFNDFMKVPCSEDFAEQEYSDNLLRKRMLNELFHEIVPVLLHEDDLNSMRWSVENRSPFLDSKFAEFAYSIPNRHLIKDGYAKWVLREAGRGLAPDAVMFDKRKRGFNASIESLVDRNNADTVEWLLSPGPIFDLVDRNALEGFLANDLTTNSFSKFMFSFISAKLFLQSDLVMGRNIELGAA